MKKEAIKDFKKIKKSIIKNHKNHIEYYNDNVDELADLMCENVADYMRFYGFYYDVRGNVGIMYVSADDEIKTFIIEDLEEEN